jgi:hypothetical protein
MEISGRGAGSYRNSQAVGKCGNPDAICHLYKLGKKCLWLSFRAKKGISLWFKFKKREIPRHAACLGMTALRVFP